jgi:ectoine hydroxylase-related dioxygenase (phytanoyl-CoA dioxygenase family)
VYALFAKTRAFDAAAIHPLLLGVLDRVLEHYQLSAPTGIQIAPGEKAQVLHYDASVYPLPRDFRDVVVNTMWALDDFTVENGATRIIPGSHRWVDRQPTVGDVVVDAVMPAGSVIFYGGKIFHGGGANSTDKPRLGVILEYVAGFVLRRRISSRCHGGRCRAARAAPGALGIQHLSTVLGYVDGRHPRRYITSEVVP